MGTFTTAYSQTLAVEVSETGGQYVEAPVSGSRGPAREGTLVAMLAGNDEAIEHVEPLINAMCAQRFRCGAVPAALSMKLAVNTFLITMVTGLAETFHFAAQTGADTEVELRQRVAHRPRCRARCGRTRGRWRSSPGGGGAGTAALAVAG
ncbi:NAD(P)-binding domain-containing protein [Micromonospora sp. NBC_00617]|uniref:NAD(P)-binding domain-containing protein n=1 Tax=Micromonospora sp. NBC_00617 TaxID=2903587 RepID=UPI0030E0CCAB